MKQNLIFILTLTAMLGTILALHGCTAMGKGDVDQRHITVKMRSTDDECYMEVNGDYEKAVTDETQTLEHPLAGGG